MTRRDLLEREHYALRRFLAAVSTDREVAAWEALEAAHRAVERGAPIEPTLNTRSLHGR